MDYFSIDYLIVYAFLIITLIIGLWAGRGIKDIREYAIADRGYGTGVLTMTLLATYMGGWHLLGFPCDIFADGLVHILVEVLFGVVFCLLFISWCIVPNMARFQDHLTMGDLMYDFYGAPGRTITGFLGLLYSTTAVSVQIFFLQEVCKILEIKTDWGIALGALVLVFYTAVGGIRSITITDVVQFVVVLVAIPLLTNLLVHQAGGINANFKLLPAEKLNFWTLGQDKTGVYDSGYYSLPILSLWFLFPGFPLSFPFIQRMLMAKNRLQLSQAYYISIAFLVVFFFLLALIGLATFVLDPQMDSRQVVGNLFESLPRGLKGLAITSLLASIMSTADSFLHAAGLSFTHDVIRPFCERRAIALDELKAAKYVTFLVGCVAILITLGVGDLLKITIYGMDLAALLFSVPLIAGIMGLKTDANAFFASLIATLCAFISTSSLLAEELVIPICILVNIVSFFGAHYFEHQRFVTVQRQGTTSEELMLPSQSISILNYFPTPSRLLAYSQNKVDVYGSSPTLFALFVGFNYMVPFFMHSDAEVTMYSYLLVVRSVGALLCVGLLLKSYWSERLLRYFPSYYHFSLLFCLPFTTTFLFFLERGNVEWLINVALSIMLLIVLVDWLTFVVLSLVGVFLGIVTYSFLTGHMAPAPDGDTLYTLTYTCLFSTLIGLLFARRKQQRFDRLEHEHQSLTTTDEERKAKLLTVAREKVQLIQTLHYSGIQDLLQVVKLLKELREKLQVSSSPLVSLTTQLEATLIPLTLQLRGLTAKATDYLRLSVVTVSFKDFLQTLQAQLVKKRLDKIVRVHAKTHCQELTCDPTRLQMLLIDSINVLHAACSHTDLPILIVIEDTQLHYSLPSVKDGYVNKLSALRLTISTQAEPLPIVQASYGAQLEAVEEIYMPESFRELT